MLLVVLLQFVNWWLEAIKLKFILSKSQEVSLNNVIKAVYAGNAVGFITPDRIGTFIGRSLSLNIKKSKTISATFLGNMAQLITTILMGGVSAILVMVINHNLNLEFGSYSVIIAVLLGVLFCVLFYLFWNPTKIHWLIRKIPWLKKVEADLAYFNHLSKSDLAGVLLLSISRYMVFGFQFYVLLQVFGIPIAPLEAFAFVGFLYVVITFIPSPFLGNLFTREAAAVVLLAHYDLNLMVLTASFFLWTINIMIPALIGSFYIKTRQVVSE